MKSFLIYLSILALLILVYFALSVQIFPNHIYWGFPFSFSAICLLMIFISKFWFLFLTKGIQESKSSFWVNANLLAFAVKFILIIGLMTFLAFYVGQGAKGLIIWTAVLYSLLLLADLIFYTKGRFKEPS